VPKRVDHEERRRQIADALLRTAATRGLHATGMREVAAEAGVSLRLVQYYFGTKEELLLAAMQHLAARFGERGMARIRRLKETEGAIRPCDVIAAILTEGLPADDERRTFTILYTAYFALSLTEPALAIAPLVRNSDAVINVVAAQLRAAQAAGDTPADLDPDLEAFSLLAMSAGLGTSVLGGQSSVEQAQAVIDYHLHRLFPATRPALQVPTRLAGTRRLPPAGSGRYLLVTMILGGWAAAGGAVTDRAPRSGTVRGRVLRQALDRARALGLLAHVPQRALPARSTSRVLVNGMVADPAPDQQGLTVVHLVQMKGRPPVRRREVPGQRIDLGVAQLVDPQPPGPSRSAAE